jgi:uncharacterized protein YjbI with pentapeptide repeats
MSIDCESCDCPKKINHLSIILISFSLICILALLRDDQIGIKAGGTIKLPFAGVDVDSGSFLLVGPAILIFITIYLHIYVQQWYNCINHQQKNICILKSDSEISRFFCNFLFFGLSPLILLLFYLISRGKPDYSNFTGFCFAVTFGLMLILFFAYRKMWVAWIGAVIFFFIFLSVISYLFSVNFDLANYIPLRLQGAEIKNHNLTKFNLKGMNAESGNFKNCVFYQQNLQLSKCKQTIFDDGNLFETNLNYSDLGSASFKNTDLSRAWMIEAGMSNANFNNAKLIKTHLYKATLESANMDNADMSNAFFNNANLKFASIRCANLNKANFSFADMTSVDFENSDMKDAILFKSNLSNAKLKIAKNLTENQIKLACINEKTTLPGNIKRSVIENCKDQPGIWWYMNFESTN